jgi:hypothetical protein
MTDTAAEYLLEVGLEAPTRGSPGLTIEIVRPLVEADRADLTQRVAAPGRVISKMRFAHHGLAQMLARGMAVVDAAACSGYAPATVRMYLETDPAFQELVHHYGEERKEIFAHEVARLQSLGLTALDELQERLAEAPEKWSNRELMEFAELLLLKSRAVGGTQAGRAAPASVSVSITFPEEGKIAPRAGVIDVEEG